MHRIAITHAEDLGRRDVPETPGGKGDRGHQGLEVARWQIDDEAADLALLHVSAAAMTSICQFIASSVPLPPLVQ